MVQLTIRYRYNDGPVKVYPTEGDQIETEGNRILVGRRGDIRPDLDLWPDGRVSRLHAKLYRHLSTWWVEDLLSRNGTILNGTPITQATALSPGDTLQLGDTRLVVEFPTGGFETLLSDVVLESQATVSEVEPPPSISEDRRTELQARFDGIREEYPDPEMMLKRFHEEIGAVFDQAEHRAIVMVDSDGELVPRASWPLPPAPAQVSYTLVRQAMQSRKAQHWTEALAPEGGRVRSLCDTASALCAPMIHNSNAVGALYLDSTDPEVDFSEEDRDLLGHIAGIVGRALKEAEGQLASFPSVFVSYAPADRVFVDRLAADLRRYRIKVWFDERLQLGSDRQEQIARAIRTTTDAFVLVMSPESVGYDPVLRELSIARGERKRIYPVLHKDCEPPEAVQSLRSVSIGPQYVAQDLDELVEAVYVAYNKDRARQAMMAERPETTRILFLAANPVDTDQLRLGEEAETIDERLRGAEFRDSFKLISHWAVSSKKLSDYLLRHTPHIVHFAGHGSTLGKIVLEDETGNAKTVPPEALSQLFRILKDDIRCVVLNACLTEDQAEGIAQEIDCVVGMSREIEDVDAISFAGGFYRGLAYGRSVQKAFELGRNEIDQDSLGGGAIPILKVKQGLDAADIVFV
jgi:pSer/pThr/pTyr-binding forkhead associated (FHA) protein